MRVEFIFQAPEDIILPIHHNHILQGMIYNSFSDKSLAQFIHDIGYKWNKRAFKLFSFSRLIGKFTIKNKKMIFESPIKFVVTSVKDDIIQDLAANIIKQNGVVLGSQRLFLSEVGFKNYAGDNEKVKITMLSPLVVYKTEMLDEKKKTRYFSPWEDEFVRLIRENLYKKYELIYGKEVGSKDFNIKPLSAKDNLKPNIVLYRGYVIKGWSGNYAISGDNELLKVAYDTGLGVKNSLGHGCFEFIDSKDLLKEET